MSETVPFVFNANFSEFLPEYRDVTNVWISDGTDGYPYGMLCARYSDERIQQLGYVTLFDIAQQQGYQGSAQDWADSIIDLAAMDKGAITTVAYQNSNSGVNHPTDEAGWTSSPTPVKGTYLWTRIKLKWKKRDQEDIIYAVSYQGADGQISVQSVNGQTGIVTLHGDNVNISSNDNQTIKHYIDSMSFTPEIATQAQIDALFT